MERLSNHKKTGRHEKNQNMLANIHSLDQFINCMLFDLLTPKQNTMKPNAIEKEKYTEEEYDQMLDEMGDVVIGSLSYSASHVLKEVDPIAYRCGFADFQEYEEAYECPVCGREHEDEDEAYECCQYQCDKCGEWFEDEDEAENCCNE